MIVKDLGLMPSQSIAELITHIFSFLERNSNSTVFLLPRNFALTFFPLKW